MSFVSVKPVINKHKNMHTIQYTNFMQWHQRWGVTLKKAEQSFFKFAATYAYG